MSWHEALRVWNQHHRDFDPNHMWLVPLRGTEEHAQVRHIMTTGKMPGPHEELITKMPAAPKAPKEPKEPKAAPAPKAKSSAVHPFFASKPKAPRITPEDVRREVAASNERAAKKMKDNKVLSQLRQVEAETKARNIARAAGALALPTSEAKAIPVAAKDFLKYAKANLAAEADAKKVATALLNAFPEGALLWKQGAAIRADELP